MGIRKKEMDYMKSSVADRTCAVVLCERTVKEGSKENAKFFC